MKKILLLVFAFLFLTSCSHVELNPEWYPYGTWKDDVFVSRPNGKFNIGQYGDVQRLSVFTDDGDSHALLSYVTDHRRIGDKVYVYSDEGYCIIDEKSNSAEIFVTAQEQPISLEINDHSVTYLNSFDEFPGEAKTIFGEMEDFWADKEYRRYHLHHKIYPDGTVEYSNKPFEQLIVFAAVAFLFVTTIVPLIIALVVLAIMFLVKRVQRKQK